MPGHDRVAPGALLVHVELVGAVPHERVELPERAGVEQLLDALAGGQLALRVLLLDRLLGGGVDGLEAQLLELRELLLVCLGDLLASWAAAEMVPSRVRSAHAGSLAPAAGRAAPRGSERRGRDREPAVRLDVRAAPTSRRHPARRPASTRSRPGAIPASRAASRRRSRRSRSSSHPGTKLDTAGAADLQRVRRGHREPGRARLPGEDEARRGARPGRLCGRAPPFNTFATLFNAKRQIIVVVTLDRRQGQAAHGLPGRRAARARSRST